MLVRNEFSWEVTPPVPGQWHATIAQDGFIVTIQSDSILATIEATGHEEKQRNQSEDIVANLLREIGLLEQIRFSKRLSSIAQFDPKEQTRSIRAFIKGERLTLRGDYADTRVEAADGTVRDSRIERLQKLQLCAGLQAKSEVLRTLTDYLLEYHADPEKKLFPIYDVIEAVQSVLGGRLHEADGLGISKKAIDRVTKIVNRERIRTGRHRGARVEALRDITPKESRICETAAVLIIERYRKLVQDGKA
jgi:hypothetical protein